VLYRSGVRRSEMQIRSEHRLLTREDIRLGREVYALTGKSSTTLIKATVDHQLQRPAKGRKQGRADLWIHYELGFGGEIHVTANDPTYVSVGGASGLEF